MFMGEFQHSLDPKGRLFIPARFREELGRNFIVTRGLENCLFAYPLREWETLAEKLRSLPLAKSEARAFLRFFFAGAAECEPDKQGRILLPATLRAYAGIEKDVVFIGVSTRVEVWSLERWTDYSSKAGEEYSALAEKLVDMV